MEKKKKKTARFIFSIDERAQKDLLARASVLQKPTHQSAYGKINPPPDISGLMRALLFYFGDFESETAEVTNYFILLIGSKKKKKTFI